MSKFAENQQNYPTISSTIVNATSMGSKSMKRVLVKKKPKRISMKDKMRPPLPLEELFRQTNKFYFTQATGVDKTNQIDPTTMPSPFIIPEDVEQFSYKDVAKAWRDKRRNDELKLKYNSKFNYKSRQQKSLLHRVFVEDPEVEIMRTVLDIDPEFFSIVADRPIKEKLSLTKYINDVREVLRTKLVTGYRQDEILLIEEDVNEEQRMINVIKEQYQSFVAGFESFLYHDYSSSIDILRECDLCALKSNEMGEELRDLSARLGTLKHKIYSLEEKWRNAKNYQRFLYQISPLAWRKEFDYLHKKTPSSDSILSDTNLDFKASHVNSAGELLTFEELIEVYRAEVAQNDEPQIYFTHPDQLVKVFQYMELQNLNSLLHKEELSVPLENLRIGIETTEKKFQTEIVLLEDMIESLAGGILWEEERAIELENLAKELINGEFRSLITDEEYLNLHVYVEDCYEACIAPNDSNLTAYDMMKGIEIHYDNLLLRLDYFPQSVVAKAEAEYRSEEGRRMEQALEANRKIELIERLRKRLTKSLAPPPVIRHAPLKWRSAPPEMITRPPPPPKPLTTDEAEYLAFFTEFCIHKDDPYSFQIEDLHNLEFLRKDAGFKGDDRKGAGNIDRSLMLPFKVIKS